MEQLTDWVSYPTDILIVIERFFWLGLGGFLGLAIITSIIRGLGDKGKTVSPKELKNIAKKATQKNMNNN